MFGGCCEHLYLLEGWCQRHRRAARDANRHPAALQLDATFVHSLSRSALHCTASGEACAQAAHTLADPLNRARARARLTLSLAVRAAGASS